MKLNSEHIDYWLFKRLENRLQPSEIIELDQFIAENSTFQKNAICWQQSVFQLDKTYAFPDKASLVEQQKKYNWVNIGMVSSEISVACILMVFLGLPLLQGQKANQSSTYEATVEEANSIKPITQKTFKKITPEPEMIVATVDSVLIAQQDSLFADSVLKAAEQIALLEKEAALAPKKSKREKIFKQAIEEIKPLKEADMLLQEPKPRELELKKENSIQQPIKEQEEEKKGFKSLFKRKSKDQKEEEPMVKAEEEY